MATVGLYERFGSLHEMLHEEFMGLSNVDLLWDATCAPIYRIADDYKHGELSKYVALERLRQHVDWVDKSFGPMWEKHELEQYLTGDWHEFDCIWDYHLWDLFVDKDADLQSILGSLNGDIDPDPVAVAKLACLVSEIVVLATYDYGWVYVFKSPYTMEGHEVDPDFDHLVSGTVEPSGGDVEAPAMPPKIISEAIDREYEDRQTCHLDDNLERYRCQPVKPTTL